MRRLAAALVLACAGAATVPEVRAQNVIADLSSREIAISTRFAGVDLLLFGATEGGGDIVVVVRGPERAEVVRRKQRVAGIWVNGASMTFGETPAYYRVAASRPLAEIATQEVLDELQIGADRIALQRPFGYPDAEIEAFREALVRNKRRQGLYGDEVAQIRVVGGRLFRTTFRFPANVPTGSYRVAVYLFDGGNLVSAEETPLSVRKAGLEAGIFNFAHNQSAWYGAIAILIALVAGWLAGVIFRRG